MSRRTNATLTCRTVVSPLITDKFHGGPVRVDLWIDIQNRLAQNVPNVKKKICDFLILLVCGAHL